MKCFLEKKNDFNILCITETHHRWEKIHIDKKLENFTSMREEKERKGGGLQILMRKDKKVNFIKNKSISREILDIEGKCYGIEMKIILVYFDVRKDKAGKEANDKIRKEIENKIENNKKEGLMILGDFNAHLEILDGRKEDENGKMINKWLNNYDLVLMNGDIKCKGTYTRTLGKQKTAIDMVIMNSTMYE